MMDQTASDYQTPQNSQESYKHHTVASQKLINHASVQCYL